DPGTKITAQLAGNNPNIKMTTAFADIFSL
ncbi:MAG: hypothetical protein RL169_105, partial [Armatimonadota bacterium]